MRALAADVLILGAGLAGLRAALSCLEAAPGLDVAVAAFAAGPSGSSFANQNNALGIHVCTTQADRQDYQNAVASRAGGAYLDPALVAIQAEEGPARLQDLAEMGLDFVRTAEGALSPHGSCFAHDSRRAYVFTGLAQAYLAFRTRLEALGCRFLERLEAVQILRDQARPGRPACGALFVNLTDGKPVAITAASVVAALGGPARLFAYSMAGPGVPGHSHGLLTRAGAKLANTGYLQYMWGHWPGRVFWQPADLGLGRYALRTRTGQWVDVAELIPNLSGQAGLRGGHCPFGYGQPDAALDLALAQHLDDTGLAHLTSPQGAPLTLAPMAHASNGGAVIDAWGQTCVPGLLAAGECATGMHGANRIGGGMVLACQVFGHRAGMRAAKLAASRKSPSLPDDALETAAALATDHASRQAGLASLGLGLSRHAVLGGRPGAKEFLQAVVEQAAKATDYRLALCLDTARGILEGLPCLREEMREKKEEEDASGGRGG